MSKKKVNRQRKLRRKEMTFEELEKKSLIKKEFEMSNKKIFRDLGLEDKIYLLLLYEKSSIPKIEIQKIVGIQLNVDGSLTLVCNSFQDPFYHIIPFTKTFKNRYTPGFDLFIFSNKEDCIKKFEEICIQRIIELSKAIGNIKKGE